MKEIRNLIPNDKLICYISHTRGKFGHLSLGNIGDYKFTVLNIKIQIYSRKVSLIIFIASDINV